ncbi:hypothetical protein DRO58_00080 [Candidatus Bathyarchaeota archaeon]|nr:MAG: hypothetical protein DRO58_00080 [Candidatus Bathyarchaeota archaeon]
MTIKVIVDTSFLLECVRRRVDFVDGLERILNSRVELVVLKPVYEEIKRISKGSDERSRYARLLLQLLAKARTHILKTDVKVDVDDLLLDIAAKMKLPVATNDSSLRRKLRRQGIPVFYLRGLSKIEVDGGDYLGLVRE